MNKIKRFAVPSLILIFGLLLSACSLTGQAAVPTMDPIALQATIDAGVAHALQTEAAKLTSTAAALPTSTMDALATLEPTAKATSTTAPMATATTKPVILVATKTAMAATKMPTTTATPSAYLCTLVSTAPVSGTKINTNTDFDAVWKVKNVGTKAWEVGYVDLKYVSDTKMQTGGDVFDVSTAVAVNGELTLTVDMKTPATAGKYTDTFALIMEGKTMCTLVVKIEAVAP